MFGASTRQPVSRTGFRLHAMCVCCALVSALWAGRGLRHISCFVVAPARRLEGADLVTTQRPARLPIGQFPTPIHELPWLTGLIGRRVLAKRDDLSGLALGGNKARKLAYLVADALDTGCDTLVATGFLQSNNAVQAAAAAARFGLDAVLCLDGATPNVARGNIVLGELYGATMLFSNGRPIEALVRDTVASLRAAGRRPYVLPPGGSTPVGIRGFVEAMLEAHEQLAAMGAAVDGIVFPTGTGGTQAGMVLGAAAIGWAVDILGISTGKTATEMLPAMRAMIAETAAYLDLEVEVPAARLRVDDRFYGAGYARPDGGDFDAIRAVARGEGLLCDPVYNGRAMKAVLDLVRTGGLPGSGDLLYWHTGGAPGFFAFDEAGEAA